MRILSGIQPSGALHLGNYFGMMRPAIELQDQGEAYYFIANYHSMTSLFDAEQRRQNTLDVALECLKTDGTIARLHEKWFDTKPAPGSAAVSVFAG